MHSLSESTSLSLIERVRSDDQPAWARLVRLYGPLVYKWARRAGLPAEDAADVGQEVFRTVAGRIADFRRDQPGQRFRSWLWQITRHKVGDTIRYRRRRDLATGGSNSLPPSATNWIMPEFEDPDSQVEDAQEVFSLALRLIQTDFHTRTWQAFWRATIEEQPMEQIAEQLQMTTKAVRQAKYRVLKRLREEFRGLLD